MQNLKKLFLLYYIFEFKDGHEDVKIIGAFSSKKKAKTALTNIKKIPELKKARKYFFIHENSIGRISWEEGFITVV